MRQTTIRSTPDLRAQTLRNAPPGSGRCMPVAVAGSIALAMTATAVAPAVAAEPAPQARTESRPHVASPGGIGSHVVVGRTAPASVQVPETYTVQRGDTVFGIALRYGLRTADVLALNGLDATSIITPGQVLRLVGSVPAPAAPAAPAAPVPPSGTYTIQKGDTLSAVAARHGTTVQALFAANGLDWSSILYPGQTVMLPGGSAPAAPAAPAPPAAPAAPPAAAVGTYTISQGDTLSAIAARHGISVQALFAANGLGWSSIIYPGQKVAIPSAMAPAASVAPAPPATSTPSPEAAPAEPVAPVEQAQPEQAPVPALDPEQQANVRLIIGIGRELGVPDRGIAIALGAAMQESWLRNLPWGDRDSLGLFQQRPSTGWGTAEQVSDPARATRAFFGGPDDPNGTTTRGLLDIAGWQDMTFSGAAQAVQISAYPDRYARWELAATTWLATYG